MLAVSVAATLVIGMVGVALVDRGVHAGGTSRWAREHLAMRLLAESAVEELGATLAQRMNAPADPLYTAVRGLRANAQPVPLPGLALAEVLTDVARQQLLLGGTIRVLNAGAAVRRVEAGDADPDERHALVAFEAAFELTCGRHERVVERVRVERALRVAAVTPPRALGRMGLVVLEPSASDLPGAAGHIAYAPAAGAPHALLDLMTHAGKDGFYKVSPAQLPAVQRALDAYAPAALAARAHYDLLQPADLRRLLSLGTPVSGVVHLAFRDPVSLTLPHFRGRCVLAFSGPVEVHDVAMDDPTRDALTIVSAEHITVAGRRVQASLVCPSTTPGALAFTERASVEGTVVTGRFPRYATMAAADFSASTFQCSPTVRPAAWAALSPYPVAVQHLRDSEEWSAW